MCLVQREGSSALGQICLLQWVEKWVAFMAHLHIPGSAPVAYLELHFRVKVKQMEGVRQREGTHGDMW